MEIGGLQKVSTIDYPEEICCVIFLKGCNFRCGFCHNRELVLGCQESGVRSQISEEEVLDFLSRRVGKIDGVCISGGEPLMSLEINFLKKIKELGYKIKIDTNGSSPEKLKELIDLGLVDYIAMDVKGCRRDYAKIVGVNVDLLKIEESMKIVYEFGSYEFRTTVVGRFHNSENLVEMAKWMNEVCRGKPKKFFLQGFRNSGDLVGADFSDEKDVGESFLLKVKDGLKEYFEEVGVRV